MRRLLLPLVLLVLCGSALAGCGDGGGSSSSACGPARREALDPASGQHVVGDAPETEYQTDPPTSGPHAPGTALDGVRDEPLTRPQQVGALEAGSVLVQHRDLAADELAALDALAADGAAVVPNDDLPSRIVATAWLFKLTCDDIDVDTLSTFVADHLGEGPGSDG